MHRKYQIDRSISTGELLDLKSKWIDSLTSPQDGMWESMRDRSIHWRIKHDEIIMGYACVNGANQLIQFYILPEYLPDGNQLFEQFIHSENIKNGVVGTNNPIYLTLAIPFMEKFSIHTYLFRQSFEVTIEEKGEKFGVCKSGDQERIVDFCHISTGDSPDWLTGYIGKLIGKGEIFVLENEREILGICEVQKSTTQLEFADIGTIVSPKYRRKGYGTFLLNKAKSIAKEWGRTPICSCEKDNLGSFRAIHNCGFVSTAQLLSVDFKLRR